MFSRRFAYSLPIYSYVHSRRWYALEAAMTSTTAPTMSPASYTLPPTPRHQIANPMEWGTQPRLLRGGHELSLNEEVFLREDNIIATLKRCGFKSPYWIPKKDISQFAAKVKDGASPLTLVLNKENHALYNTDQLVNPTLPDALRATHVPFEQKRVAQRLAKAASEAGWSSRYWASTEEIAALGSLTDSPMHGVTVKPGARGLEIKGVTYYNDMQLTSPGSLYQHATFYYSPPCRLCGQKYHFEWSCTQPPPPAEGDMAKFRTMHCANCMERGHPEAWCPKAKISQTALWRNRNRIAEEERTAQVAREAEQQRRREFESVATRLRCSNHNMVRDKKDLVYSKAHGWHCYRDDECFSSNITDGAVCLRHSQKRPWTSLRRTEAGTFQCLHKNPCKVKCAEHGMWRLAEYMGKYNVCLPSSRCSHRRTENEDADVETVEQFPIQNPVDAFVQDLVEGRRKKAGRERRRADTKTDLIQAEPTMEDVGEEVRRQRQLEEEMDTVQEDGEVLHHDVSDAEAEDAALRTIDGVAQGIEVPRGIKGK